MTAAGSCAEIRLELGVYVLGVIGAADRSLVEAHLACCADCRAELAELAGLPRLLRRATAKDAESPGLYGDGARGRWHEPWADLGPRCLLGRAARLRKRRTWRRMAGAARVCPVVAGATAACGRHRIVPDRTCPAIMGKRGGDPAR
jgi:anti-sigma factor RsiW